MSVDFNFNLDVDIGLGLDLGTGNFSPVKVQRGSLIEYTSAARPLMLSFEFNPQSITRTRTARMNGGDSPGTRGGYDFASPQEAPRASQGVTVEAEVLTMKILLDATDRMNGGDPLATRLGVQPELDVLRSMIEPKSQSQPGVQTLAALGEGPTRAFARHEYASVLLFSWGVQVLPVFMTGMTVEAKEHLPSLLPYRAEVALTLKIIESNNPFYQVELKRQLATASAAAAVTPTAILGTVGSLGASVSASFNLGVGT